jgi:hypothetical protein
MVEAEAMVVEAAIKCGGGNAMTATRSQGLPTAPGDDGSSRWPRQRRLRKPLASALWPNRLLPSLELFGKNLGPFRELGVSYARDFLNRLEIDGRESTAI